jgi:hypothetical protein
LQSFKREKDQPSDLVRAGIAFSDDIDDEAWQLQYVMTEVEVALQARVDELYLLTDYHRRALLEKDSRLAEMHLALVEAKDKHAEVVLRLEREGQEEKAAMASRIIRLEQEVKIARARATIAAQVKEERDALEKQLQESAKAHAEALEKKDLAMVNTRTEIRREFTKKREDDVKAVRAELKKAMVEEGVQMAEEVESLRYAVRGLEERVQEEWIRSRAVEADLGRVTQTLKLVEAEKDRYLKENAVLRRTVAERDTSLAEAKRAATEREAAFRNRIRGLKAANRILEGCARDAADVARSRTVSARAEAGGGPEWGHDDGEDAELFRSSVLTPALPAEHDKEDVFEVSEPKVSQSLAIGAAPEAPRALTQQEKFEQREREKAERAKRIEDTVATLSSANIMPKSLMDYQHVRDSPDWPLDNNNNNNNNNNSNMNSTVTARPTTANNTNNNSNIPQGRVTVGNKTYAAQTVSVGPPNAKTRVPRFFAP